MVRWVSVTPLLSSKIVNVTCNELVFVIDRVVVTPSATVPSLKSHLYLVILPSGSVEPLAFKVIVSPFWVWVNVATGSWLVVCASLMVAPLSLPGKSAAVAGVMKARVRRPARATVWKAWQEDLVGEWVAALFMM